MIHDLKPYPAYNDTGGTWLREVPVGWKVVRSKYVVREIDVRSSTGEELHLSMSQKLGLVPSSHIEEHRLMSESYVGAKLCNAGDIVLNRLKAHLGVFALAQQSGLVSSDYTVFRPRRDACPRYFELVLRSPTCRVALNGKLAFVEYQPDTDLRDTEQIPLLEEGGIEGFFRREVLPHVPDAWIDASATKIGYEISFTRYFYEPQPLRTLEEIRAGIAALEKETEGLLFEIIGTSERTG